ncbi:MAG: helix-turn-helix domain-containing protein [Coriobacteriales bacterium]|nr:helix-turn-helix domain-containing protein [Coriobacteriales bacterium]
MQIRRAHGLSQAELAARLGLTRQQIQRWESVAYRTTSLERVAAVAEALGIDDVPERWTSLAAESAAGYGTVAYQSRPVRDLGEVIARIREHALELQTKFGITRIAVFGSFARGEQTAESDVDLIVELKRSTRQNVFGAERELNAILGRKADTGSLESLRPRIRSRVAKELVDAWRA